MGGGYLKEGLPFLFLEFCSSFQTFRTLDLTSHNNKHTLSLFVLFYTTRLAFKTKTGITQVFIQKKNNYITFLASSITTSISYDS